MNKTCNNCLHRELCNVHGYIDADECGVFKDKSRYIELPCKVGKQIFFVVDEQIYYGNIFSFSMELNGLWFYAKYDNGLTYWHKQDDIGKRVFLTKEEAEQALRKEDEGK